MDIFGGSAKPFADRLGARHRQDERRPLWSRQDIDGIDEGH